jgi:hypothetical protein
MTRSRAAPARLPTTLPTTLGVASGASFASCVLDAAMLEAAGAGAVAAGPPPPPPPTGAVVDGTVVNDVNSMVLDELVDNEDADEEDEEDCDDDNLEEECDVLLKVAVDAKVEVAMKPMLC